MQGKAKKNIVLIGMPGVGKSTLGVLLAKALGMDFTDTDILIQQREGKLLQEIIDEKGLDGFLQVEEDVISSMAAENTVIATGGSAVLSQKGMESLLKNGRAVYLKAPLDELQRRLTDITTRGVVMKKGESLEELFRRREPLYEKYGEITADCSKGGVESSVEEIIKSLKA